MYKNITNMMGLDFFMDSLSAESIEKIQAQTNTNQEYNTPLLSWEFHYTNYLQKLNKFQLEKDIDLLQKLKKKFNWEINFHKLLKSNSYQALVLTDKNSKIVWVNDGFSEMTGYDRKFALNKTPSFLQGEKTTSSSLKHIKENIKAQKPFTETVINYRKNKSMYKCELKIFPLTNINVTHYLALEKEIA